MEVAVAGAAVSTTIKVVMENLLSFPVEVIGHLWNFKKDLEKLKRSVTMIREFLEDAEMKQVTDMPVKCWLLKLNALAFDADYVFDQLNYPIIRKKVETDNKMKRLQQLPPPPPFLNPSPPRASNPSSLASAPPLSRSRPRPISYASVVNSSRSGTNANNSNSDSGSLSLLFLGGNEFLSGGGCGDGGGARQSESSMSPSDPMVFPFGEDVSGGPNPFHHRSCSVSDAVFLSHLEEGGGGCRPCMYFVKGFCKNDSSCKFVHSDFGAGETELGCPSSNVAASSVDAFLRMKAL